MTFAGRGGKELEATERGEALLSRDVARSVRSLRRPVPEPPLAPAEAYAPGPSYSSSSLSSSRSDIVSRSPGRATGICPFRLRRIVCRGEERWNKDRDRNTEGDRERERETGRERQQLITRSLYSLIHL